MQKAALKNTFRLLPAVLSALLLAAHFWRADLYFGVVVSLALPVLLLVRHRWADRAVQAGLVLGTFEWARTLVILLAARQAVGQPWGRLVLIMGMVALFTGSAALLVPVHPVLNKENGPGNGLID